MLNRLTRPHLQEDRVCSGTLINDSRAKNIISVIVPLGYEQSTGIGSHIIYFNRQAIVDRPVVANVLNKHVVCYVGLTEQLPTTIGAGKYILS